MYKAFLSLRYLRTRYIAMASIVSVMLGVATMIVVNSVMKGFTSEMRSRIQGLLSDIVIETNSLDGAENARKMFADVRSVAGDKVSGMTATVEVWGLITFPFAGQYTTRPITLIGIQPEEKATVGPFKQYLESYHPVLDGKQIVRRLPAFGRRAAGLGTDVRRHEIAERDQAAGKVLQGAHRNRISGVQFAQVRPGSREPFHAGHRATAPHRRGVCQANSGSATGQRRREENPGAVE